MDLSDLPQLFLFFFFNDTATTEIYTLSLHDALPIWRGPGPQHKARRSGSGGSPTASPPCTHTLGRSEEHTSELQSPCNLVCRLLLVKKKIRHQHRTTTSDEILNETKLSSTVVSHAIS